MEDIYTKGLIDISSSDGEHEGHSNTNQPMEHARNMNHREHLKLNFDLERPIEDNQWSARVTETLSNHEETYVVHSLNLLRESRLRT